MSKQKIILKGIPASAGVASGNVKLVKNPFNQFKEGNILVAKITDPSMVHLMAKAAAIVTDIGGITSHPAIISRELGIPCVVSTLKATKILRNNQKVKVDGGKGIIYQI